MRNDDSTPPWKIRRLDRRLLGRNWALYRRTDDGYELFLRAPSQPAAVALIAEIYKLALDEAFLSPRLKPLLAESRDRVRRRLQESVPM